MATVAHSRGRYIRWSIWVIAFAVVGKVAWTNRRALVDSVGLMSHAHTGWLILAIGSVGALYLCRALVYRIPLRLLGYTVPWTFLWQVAIIASSVQQLVPSGGASSYAFITFALHRRGVSGGQASLIALIDTISYAFAAATLVIISLVYVAFTGGVDASTLLGFAPGAVLAAFAVWVYHRQRDKDRFIRLVLRTEKRVAAWLRTTWPEAPVRDFLEEFYEGKAIVARHHRAFVTMIALQYLAVCADASALYLTFLALDVRPGAFVAFLGFIVALAAGTVVSAPAGGGSFELVMSAYFVRAGMNKAQAVAGALLFRVVSFWVPVLVSGILMLGFRRRRREIRRAAKSPAA